MDRMVVNPAALSQPSIDNSQKSRQRTALILRCQKAIFSAYRLDQFADPDGFMAQLGVILEQYADEVVLHVSSPLTGIQRESDFPPSIAKIVAACDAYADRVERRKKPQRKAMPRIP